MKAQIGGRSGVNWMRGRMQKKNKWNTAQNS